MDEQQTKDKLTEILKQHQLWLCNEGGNRANLSNANLSYADLSCADLRRADLSYANLSYADLSYANLSYANLSYANLSCADLSCADLRRADLSCADLRRADLRGAILRGADLRGAKNINTVKSNYTTTNFHIACPESGVFVGFKKLADDKIAKIRIPANSPRSSATSRKCRAKRAKVLKIWNGEGAVCDSGVSMFDNSFEYRVGEYVECDEWDDNRWEECSGGIHFFLTWQEAEQW